MTNKPTFDLTSFMKQVEGQKFPPVDKWNPPFCGDIDMRIAADGTWFYMGTPITRARMVRLFSTVLRKDTDGKTYLVTPVEKIGITVEDAPFVAVSCEILGEGSEQIISFTTNVGDVVVAGADHPVRVFVDPETQEPRPYIHVRGRLEALINRPVFYELVDRAEQMVDGDTVSLSLKSGGQIFSLGSWSEKACVSG